jgi:hypothetical protein
MGQILSAFEDEIEPLVPKAQAKEFKALVRNRLNGFESDIGDLIDMMKSGKSPNAHAQDVRDGLPGSSRVHAPADRGGDR